MKDNHRGATARAEPNSKRPISVIVIKFKLQAKLKAAVFLLLLLSLLPKPPGAP